jgi:hypothetical protein
MNPVDPTFLEPVTVNILIVCDRRIRFDNHDSSLLLMIEALHEKASSVARVSTTTAYRKAVPPTEKDSDGPGAEFQDFRFAGGVVIENYDEIWLFGDQKTPNTTELTEEEIKALRQFMEKGGGVFATGDHENLGEPMNSKLPRVGSMRTWRKELPSGMLFPPGDSTLPEAHDTRIKAGGSSSQESDPVPQKITPRDFKAKDSSVYPHPLLDGPRGAISVLPDHMHEGDCPELNPADLKDEEYPRGDTIRPLPLVIADSLTFAPNPADLFGAIGAYDGHLAGIGRVVVDASFHHFLNENLRGLIANSPKPTSVDSGIYAYEDIRNYFQNIALWLAPPQRQEAFFTRALWHVRWRSRVRASLLLKAEAINARSIAPADILSIGQEARKALNKLTSRSLIFLWSLELLRRLPNGGELFRSLYPWQPDSNLTGNAAEDAVDFLLGGVMTELALRFPRKQEDEIRALIDQLDGIIEIGAKAGLRAFISSSTT